METISGRSLFLAIAGNLLLISSWEMIIFLMVFPLSSAQWFKAFPRASCSPGSSESITERVCPVIGPELSAAVSSPFFAESEPPQAVSAAAIDRVRVRTPANALADLFFIIISSLIPLVFAFPLNCFR